MTNLHLRGGNDWEESQLRNESLDWLSPWPWAYDGDGVVALSSGCIQLPSG